MKTKSAAPRTLLVVDASPRAERSHSRKLSAEYLATWRAARTVAITAEGYAGLAKDKQAAVIVTSGGDFRPGTPAAGYDFLSPYVRGILGFIGIANVEFIYAHSLSDDSVRERSLAEAQSTARKLAAA